jgi:hypothetical protein
MSPAAAATIARLPHLTVGELRDLHREVFGHPTASRHKTWLVRRIAWQVQANEEGGLTERALARAAELAQGKRLRERRPADLPASQEATRTRVLALPQSRDPGLVPGVVLKRSWHGQDHLVTVHPDGFEHDGQIYRSLSAVAAAITGTKWNGHVFFRLKQRGNAA